MHSLHPDQELELAKLRSQHDIAFAECRRAKNDRQSSSPQLGTTCLRHVLSARLGIRLNPWAAGVAVSPARP